MLRNKRGRDGERPAHRDEEWPPLAVTRESPSTETKTQHSNQSINKINLFKKKKKDLYMDNFQKQLVMFILTTLLHVAHGNFYIYNGLAK